MSKMGLSTQSKLDNPAFPVQQGRFPVWGVGSKCRFSGVESHTLEPRGSPWCWRSLPMPRSNEQGYFLVVRIALGVPGPWRLMDRQNGQYQSTQQHDSRVPPRPGDPPAKLPDPDCRFACRLRVHRRLAAFPILIGGMGWRGEGKWAGPARSILLMPRVIPPMIPALRLTFS